MRNLFFLTLSLLTLSLAAPAQPIALTQGPFRDLAGPKKTPSQTASTRNISSSAAK